MFRKRIRSSREELRGGCVVLFGMPFLLAGLAMAGLCFWQLAAWWMSQSWEEIPCRIVDAELQENHADGNTTYRVVGRYRYVWKAREYESERISFSLGSDNLGDFHQRVYREMKRRLKECGGLGHCHVNPEDPSEAVLVRDFRPGKVVFVSLFATIFPLVGGGLAMGGWLGERRTKANRQWLEAHPHETWRTNPDWRKSPVPETGMRFSTFGVPAAGWVLLVNLPILATGLASGVLSSSLAWWVALPGLPVLLASWIIARAMRKRLRVGKTGLVLDTLPLRPGGEVRGAWVTSKPLRPVDSPVLRMIGTESVSTSSAGRTNHTTRTIWEHETPLDVAMQMRDVMDYRLPFGFFLPVHVRESGAGGGSSEIGWKMEFRLPGTPVKSVFEVPVVRGKGDEQASAVIGTSAGSVGSASGGLPALLERAHLDAEFSGERLSVLRCTPRRWLTSVLFLVFFDLLWTGMAVFLWISDAPILFRMVWPVSAAGIWLLVIHLLVSRKELRLEGNQIALRSVSLAGVKLDRISADDVAGFSHSSNTQVGNTRYYVLWVDRVDGGKVTIADGIAGDSVVSELEHHLEQWRSDWTKRSGADNVLGTSVGAD